MFCPFTLFLTNIPNLAVNVSGISSLRAYNQPTRQTDGRTDEQTDRQTDRQTGRQASKQADTRIQTNTHTHRDTHISIKNKYIGQTRKTIVLQKLDVLISSENSTLLWAIF